MQPTSVQCIRTTESGAAQTSDTDLRAIDDIEPDPLSGGCKALGVFMTVGKGGLMIEAARQVMAFETLLDRCLGITSSDHLLVIYDESLSPFWESFQHAVESRTLSGTLLFLPISYQLCLMRHAMTSNDERKVELPAGLIAAISASTIILNVLDGGADTSLVRKAVNHTPRPANCRLATIPGISSEILKTILESPIDQVIGACEFVAWVLGEAKKGELISYDSTGRDYTLRMELGGWDNEPLMSPGVLLPGSWGNIPPGETFCCPKPETVNGRICINGSVPDYVIAPGDEVILEFVKGKLVSWTAPPGQHSSPAFSFFERTKMRGNADGDSNWNTFAELGIGLNPAVRQLTGNSLFDEKALHTVHIAIGDNSTFGDNVRSHVHLDMVTWRPTLCLDGDVLVMDRGEIQAETIASLRGKHIITLEDNVPNDVVIFLREARIGREQGRLKRRLSKAYRVNYVSIVDQVTSDQLDALCDALKSYNMVHVATFLMSHPAFHDRPTMELLRILNHYRILGMTPAAAGTGVRQRALDKV